MRSRTRGRSRTRELAQEQQANNERKLEAADGDELRVTEAADGGEERLAEA